MKFFLTNDRAIQKIVAETFYRIEWTTSEEIKKALLGARNIEDLQREIATLTITRDKISEDRAREKREVEHLIGLERKRQEQEMRNAVREAKIEVAQQNLDADKERFKAEMEFQRERLTGEVDSLRKMVEQLLQAVPSAKIFAKMRVGGESEE